MRRCAEWIIARQERDGCWGGIQPPWVYSLIALHLLGYGLDHPVIRRGLAGLDRFTIWEDTPGRAGAAVRGLPVPGLGHGAGDDRAGRCRAAGRRSGAAVRGPVGAGRGDPRARRLAGARPGLAPAGWAFEFDNDGYPDIDDTAEVVLALGRVGCQPAASTGHGRAGRGRAASACLSWLTGMQSRDGGWGAFDADNTATLVTKLPFCDFGEVIDPPSADVTAHTVEALAAAGLAGSRAARRGVAWLLRNQEPDGSWFGRWGANYVYGTGAVVPALIAAGVQPGKPAIRRAVDWLVSHQNSRRRLGRGPALLRRPGLGRPRRVDRLADRLGTARPARGRAAQDAHAQRASAAWRWLAATPAARTGPGTSRSSPGPGSPATSTSTTTCTGWCSRSARSAATWGSR